MEKLLRYIRARKQDISETMLYGNVKNMEHYRQLIGNIEAYQAIEDMIGDILEKEEQDD